MLWQSALTYMHSYSVTGQHRILESERIKTLVGGGLYMTPALGLNKAVLVCAEPQNMDLVIGQDLITGYMGSAKLNHEFRVFETALLRIKCKDAVVVFG